MDITGHDWYVCVEAKQTVLAEPYSDLSTGKMILSIVSTFYNAAGENALGMIDIDIALDI